ncbi:MAG: recombination mediator RecR [Longimicrobiales bacterium]|nr:recombination mediator RecR [Longimicrobiales bacterium]
MSAIEALAREFGRFPGVGPKTAQRLVYHLLKRPADEGRRLAAAIRDTVDRIHPCPRCGNFAEEALCEVCASPRREGDVVCVVEEAFEVAAVERSGTFRGLYHVLGGHLSPLDGIGPDELNVGTLLERVRAPDSGIRELILATSAGVEGEATAVYLEGLFRPLGVRVTRLARGIPVGSDLDYVDGSTLAEALAGRREMA